MFVRDLPPSITEYSLYEFFNHITGGQVERTKKINDFAFVHFTDRKAAEEAMAAADQILLEVGL